MWAKHARAVCAGIGALAVVGAALAAAPAYAAGGGNGSLDVFVDDVHLAAHGAPGKVYPVYGFEAGNVTAVKLTIDLSKLTGLATASFPDASSHCSLAGDTATCDLPDNTGTGGEDDPGSVQMIPLKLTPSAGAVAGADGSIGVTISGDGAKSVSYEAPVTVADGPDVTLLQPEAHATLRPGDSTDMPYGMENTGSQPADHLFADFLFTSGMTPYQYKNCAYFTVDPSEWIANCEFDDTLAPGDSLLGSLPLSSKKDAAFEEEGILIVGMGDSMTDSAASKRWSALRRAHLGTGAKTLTLKPTKAHVHAADIDESDNIGFATYDVKTKIDLGAQGQSLNASTTKMTVGVRDNGPATINAVTLMSGEIPGVLGMLVKVPDWAKVTDAPDTCAGRTTPDGTDHPGRSAYPYYYCVDANLDGDAPLFIPVGGAFSATFSIKVTGDSGANGTVTVDTSSGVAKSDTDQSNNVAQITLGTAGEPSLPVTGSKAGLIASGGAMLVLLGGLLFILGRRRRRPAAL